MKKLFVIVIAASVALGAFADTWKDSSGKTWSYTVADGKATIKGVSPASGSIAIPSWVNGHPVTSIDSYAFLDCSGFTSVTIPDSVTSIGASAFHGCVGLTSVIIGNGVTSIGGDAFFNCSGLTSVTIGTGVTSIGDEAFNGCSGLRDVVVPQCVCSDSMSSVFSSSYQSITNVVISDGVTSIGPGAFEECGGLTSVTIPDSVTSIGASAFDGCVGLTSVTIPNNVTSIGDWAFRNCSSLMGVTIPDSVTSIGASAFYGCVGLTSVTIPSSVTNIGYWAFYNCSGLTSVTIPDSVTSIGPGAFEECSGLTSVTIPDSVTRIRDEAFRGCSGLTSVTIPDSVTSIGDNAFYNCSGLTSVTIPNSVTSIGASAFYGCSGLTSVTVPGSVTSIGARAFFNCSGLTSVTIPDSVTSVGDSAFYGCSGLRDVVVPQCVCSDSMSSVFSSSYQSITNVVISDSVTNIGYRAFYNCSGLTSVTIPDSVTSIGEAAFAGCSGLASVTIPDSVTSIGDATFGGCSGLTSVTIPDSVTSIGDSAFRGCSGLTSVTIPDSVTSVGDSAFYGCDNVKNVTVPGWRCGIPFGGVTNLVILQGTTSIGQSAFHYCSSLTSVTIPDSVTSIGAYAFRGCSGLTSVTIPDSVTSVGDSAFYGCSGLRDVMVPQCVCSDSMSSVFSSSYQSITNVVISDSVTNIGYRAFYNCSGLTSVTIPDSVTSIGTSAFCGCSGLTGSLTIPDGVTSIGGDAFFNCSGLTSVTIGTGVTNIGYRAFSGCSGLTSVTIPDSVTSIVSCAFYGCSGLTSVTIPDSVTSIGSNAFQGTPFYNSQPKGLVVLGRVLYCIKGTCPSAVTIPEGVARIEDSAFSNCSSLMSVTIPNSLTSIGAYAFSGCSGLESIFASVAIDEALVSGLDDTLLEKVVWTDVATGGDAEWAHSKEIVHSGLVSWKSGAVADNQESWFEMDVDHPGKLSFWWKASSESDGEDVYDYAYLSVDGVPQGSLTDGYRLEGVAIGGKTDWVNVVVDVLGEGPHTIRWTYCKDDVDEAGTGDDCVWLDDIVWTPLVSVAYDIGGASGVAPSGVSELAGATLTLPDTAGFSWADHVFDGWSDGENTYLPGETYEVPRTDVTFTAQWIRKSALTFALNGGSGTAPMTIKEVPGIKVTLPLATGLSRAKHTLGGWSDGATTYHEGAEYVIGDQDVAFTAVWTANTLAAPVISSADVSNGGTTEAAYATISMSAEAGAEIRYTTDGSVPTSASPRYTAPFVADGMNVAIKAIAVRDNYFDSDVATFSFTRKPYSLSECLGIDGATVTTGGSSSWGRVLGGEAYDGVAALKSGSLGDSQTNWVQMVVSGPGTISFWWNVSSKGTNRGKRRDGCLFMVDGVEAVYSDGTTNVWTQVTVEVDAPGAHALKWAYGKNDNGTSAGDDCAWLAEVVWTQGVDPSVPHWSIVYENLKGAANTNPSKYYYGYGATFQPLPDISGYTFAGWTPSSIPANATGDKVVTANWNWIPQDAVVEASITGGRALNVDSEWVRTELVQRFGAGKQQTFIAKFGDNFAAALTKKTGKFDGAGKELSVWHDYVAGTDPTDVNSTFKAEIQFKDGMPVVKWEPNLNSNGEVRVYTVYGKADLGDAWHSPTNALDHFFKVDVAMPQSGTVTFNVGGGSSVDPIVVSVGQPIGELPTPTRQNYDFLGWFTAAEGGTEITPETIVTDDMTIFARWDKRLSADLVHRWSFNGDLTDSVGGQTATKVGNVTMGAEQYTLAGGSQGSSYINLGANVLPNDGSAVTLEMWVTQLSAQYYARIWDFGNTGDDDMYMGLFNTVFDSDAIVYRNSGVFVESNLLSPYTPGTEFYIAVVMTPQNNGSWKLDFYKKDSSGNTLRSYSATTTVASWTLLGRTQSKCYLGHAIGSAYDANASYNEFRIWKKAMTEEELTASAIAGPDADLEIVGINP